MFQRYVETYFFTSTILNWNNLLADDNCKQFIISSINFLVAQKRVYILAFVIMPNHQHLIWQIREGHERQNVQRDFMKYTAQQMKFYLSKNNAAVLQKFRVDAADREFQIWERNPLSVAIVNESVFMQKLNYIHLNPVVDRWRLCESPEQYRYLSARFYWSGKDEFGFLGKH